ncbi:anhydro-N-acetylmuramic acid kinase [Paenibacillus sp. YN15]|uniref:anhydro-N-acetylmuramic acid kinase n=1 Tax=Paenibacillus sp. YN15 TaxID=1742774 RepID=UPI00215CB608|nr:anhydro-N-acetylmuramic acid kinase [Paenibacillus sp. YN15]
MRRRREQAAAEKWRSRRAEAGQGNGHTREGNTAERAAENCGRRYAIGLMSGTSVDGIDAALVEIAGRPGEDCHRTGGSDGGNAGDRGSDDDSCIGDDTDRGRGGSRSAEEGEPGDEGLSVRLLAFLNLPYPEETREAIFRLFDPRQATVDRVGEMNVGLGRLYAEAALAVAAEAGISPEAVSVIGSHGQTIWHAPEQGYTVQIGEGSVIAELTGIPCVSDFRPADLAAGGQGAPLVPYTEYLLYRNPAETLLLQNIGGIGNITVIPAGADSSRVFAFDTGPGNMLIDGVMRCLRGGRIGMDEGGRMAASGRCCAELLKRLQAEAYYRLPPPKSTGRELFGDGYVERLMGWREELEVSGADLAATVTRLTAWSIGDAYRRFIRDRHPADRMIVGGGGSYNPTLLRELREELAPVPVVTQEEIGLNSDAKEAVAFALLADCTRAGLPGSLPAVTGARHPAVLGKLSLPYRQRP